jgi:hypothetical protein
LVPFLLIDRSPCQDPFFDPLAEPLQRRARGQQKERNELISPPVVSVCRWLHFGTTTGPRARDGQIGVDDENANQRRVAGIVETVQAGPQPIDVVVDNARGRFLAAVVEDNQHGELATASYSILSWLSDVAGAVSDGNWGASGHFEFGDDVVMKEVVEPSGHSVAAG